MSSFASTDGGSTNAKAVTGEVSSYVSGHNLSKPVSETTKRKKLPIL